MQRMIRALCFLLMLCLVQSGHAQRVQILPGSRLVYEVEDWGKKYKYIVAIKEISDSTQVLEWKTDGNNVYKGKSVNETIDSDNADRVLIKPNMESEEWLDDYTQRLRLPANMQADIELSEDTLEYGVDMAEALLVRRTGGGAVKEVLYNGRSINFEYRRYNDPLLQVTLGFMPFGARGWWLYTYKDENVSMRLAEVKTVIPIPQPVPPASDSLFIADPILQ